ncbi:hypothetical protein SAMN04489762_1314 [Terribacillus saccharophilus]|uniref:Uncharacterized protein n=1 Tax=Terribacillus saccharophilus TaxID=361277 RepID=A0AAX2EDY2_9BACI|nr:hypothetical protein SAMN04489762_1314 [Terribacillus saccharophilus]
MCKTAAIAAVFLCVNLGLRYEKIGYVGRGGIIRHKLGDFVRDLGKTVSSAKYLPYNETNYQIGD